jgi:hypothetical protein
LENTIAELRRRFGWQRGDKLRIIFHQSFKRYKDSEAAAVKELVGQLRDFEVEYAFVTVGDDHDWKLFEPAEKGIQNFGQGPRKGAGVPARGQIVPLGPYAALLTLTGPRQLKTELQGGPRPLLVAIHHESTFKSLDYVAKQVFDLSFMSWRTFMPTTGYSVTATERNIERGDWHQDKVWRRALYGRIVIDLIGYQKWVESRSLA